MQLGHVPREHVRVELEASADLVDALRALLVGC